MSEHRDISLEGRALAIVAALPESVVDALALRLAQRREEPLGVDQRHADDEARARLLVYLTEHGPASQRQARSAAGVAGWKADALIRDLEGEGLIENAGTGRARAWVTCTDGSGPMACVRPADTRDTRSDAALNGRSDRAEAVSAKFIDGPCPDPTSCQYRGRLRGRVVELRVQPPAAGAGVVNTTTQPRQPIAGPLFRRAAALPIPGQKRRRLLCVIAAWADIGQESPPMADLARRLGLTPPKVDRLLDSLQADGWITIEWAGQGRPGHRGGPHRNHYQLRLPDDPPRSAHGTPTEPARRPNADTRATTATSTRPTPTREDANGNGQGRAAPGETSS